MPLNCHDADIGASGRRVRCRQGRGTRLVSNVIKFPDEGRIVRFGRADGADESATIIILPVIRIERYVESEAEPHTHPPADNGGRRRVRRR
jgi:hypothetical protein